MTHTSIGRKAEQVALNELRSQGYIVIKQNWRTRRCEIDLVALKNNIIYFVEVKYRQSTEHGSGLEYITKTKYKQMLFAAETWIAENNWDGDYRLAAIELTGNDFLVTNLLTEI